MAKRDIYVATKYWCNNRRSEEEQNDFRETTEVIGAFLSLDRAEAFVIEYIPNGVIGRPYDFEWDRWNRRKHIRVKDRQPEEIYDIYIERFED